MGLENLSKTTFGEAIRQARQKAGLNKKELADRCGINSGYLSRIESGEQMPGDKLSVRMARVLHLDPAKIFLYSHILGIKPEFRDFLLQLPKYCQDGQFKI